MRRVGHLFVAVTAFGNLVAAARAAVRGKTTRPAVAEFLFRLEPELLALQRDLVSGVYTPRPYRTFEVFEPKRRSIAAANVRDRVVHHAVCRVLEPHLERRLIHDTYACRVGKGTHAAVARAQHFCRRFAYFAKGDVRSFFAGVDHGVLKGLLRRLFKDPRLLALLDRIVDHGSPLDPPGRGLPIGNLTSQHFANLYLGEMDHHAKQRLGVAGYLRYMDDFVLFGDDKATLHRQLAGCRAFLAAPLGLELKDEATLLAPVQQGLGFLGFRVFPGTVRLDRVKWVRFRRGVRAQEAAWLRGDLPEEDLARSVGSRIGHMLHADTLAARQQLFSGASKYG